MTDRGSKLDQARESLARAQARLDEVRGTETEQDYEAMVARFRARVDELTRGSVVTAGDVMMLRCRDSFVSPRSGVTLTVVGRSFGHADVEEVKAGNVDALEVRATADGRGFLRGTWHTTADGPEAESVWAEVWTLGGCQFHGCVDSESRKVVQVG